MDTTLDPWQQDVAGFVQAHLPPAPARVLEVGCGDGWLCHHLAGMGYESRGIDPQAPDDPRLLQVPLEDFHEPSAFDAVVANLSLHHIRQLDEAVDQLADVLSPGGVAVIVEFAWDRLDDRTAHWCLERLPAQLDEDSWLHGHLAVLQARHAAGKPLQARELLAGWAAEEGLHGSVPMRDALRGRFVEHLFEWSPYLYPELEVTRREERAAIHGGAIEPTGFRMVGVRRATSR